MAKVERTVYLISEQQREALLGYLQNRPYREVAAGIQFLVNAPTASVNVDIPETDASMQPSGEAVEAEATESKELIAA
jgi:hypothetical protein